ncbi:hypothetical protein [Nostocoides sp. HKS02]|uniref:hypothetical protein n=1 Tax=Nostocoides sp. HKS02 TaxID=1813880 RepID=UPI0012B4D073|nr:hypothetical protein [Tetrasphaera sp. HKS02]QGN58901.1 hypothetical protein GKE56_14520 [Tetrasphaera sp. HKS02]
MTQAALLGLAIAAQQKLDLDDPADFWYQQGARDAYAYAAAMHLTGQPGEAVQAAADRVVHLLGEQVTDLGVLMESTLEACRPATGLTWVGQLSFDRLTRGLAGIDHDTGSRWGALADIRIFHRLTTGASKGLLYAHDRTWDEYAILDPAAHVDTVAATVREASHPGPNLALDDFVALLRANPPMAIESTWPEVQL